MAESLKWRNNMPKVSVCIATRNGEQHIEEQLASILCQLGRDDEVIISDDSSTDETVAIIRGIADERVRLYENNTFYNAALNFGHALGKASGDVMFLSDQDDVWLPHKIEVTRARMAELEERYGNETPLLVHTDLKVVTVDLETVAESLWRFQKTDPWKGSAINRLLVQNTVSGCTVMINKALRDIALPIPTEAIMHDWWLALVAASLGEIGHVPEPTLLYRQHRDNNTGAQPGSMRNLLRRLVELEDTRKIILKTQRQAGAISQRFANKLVARDREMIDIYSRLSSQSFVMKRYYILRYGFFLAGLGRNIGMLIFC